MANIFSKVRRNVGTAVGLAGNLGKRYLNSAIGTNFDPTAETMHLSEWITGTPAQAAEPTSSFGPNNPANYPQKPAGVDTGGNDYANNLATQYTQPVAEQAASAPDPVEPPPYSAMLNGTKYGDPTAYYNAITEASVAEYNRQNKLLTDAYSAGLLDFVQYQEQVKQARDTVKQQYADAMSSIGGRFSALSSDAYQSSQGTAENRAKDLTNQNYSNIAGQEANLGLQRTSYDKDYANKLEANRISSQNQIDTTYNSMQDSLADTAYANTLGSINAPKLNSMAPMDSSILGVYDNLAQLSASGNQPAIKQTIDGLQADQSIKDWLYTRFTPQTI